MNLEWLLFYGVWSPWKGPYELKEEYKHPQNIFRLGKISKHNGTLSGLEVKFKELSTCLENLSLKNEFLMLFAVMKYLSISRKSQKFSFCEYIKYKYRT